ncbi:MAG TPA: hypothetical protein DCZ11_01970 [Gammaproteobacteria bacterium]|uniref:hypothetical protein n=1 Tax=Immundisolibacter sp. TaxID=1934948 RepID=UPI000E9620A2|nr:hypothetical protein [Gammaproteobacteria bacterium]HCZ47753.1 hypothetical protein [Gammaproteobacteria bacterium]MCH77191.1 hypothetical protein [Gammaproteobacteria bacterium]
MSAFKFALTAVLAVALAHPVSGFARTLDDVRSHGVDNEPTSAEMVADALVARPIYAVATVLGGALFVATLPFSALGGNVKEAANELVTGPAQGLLTRCLGCVRTVQETQFERPAQ